MSISKDSLPVPDPLPPYLGGDPDQFEFDPPEPFRPPDWLGWAIIALIITLTIGGFRKNDPVVSSLHLKARPAKEREIEYPRRVPMVSTPDSIEIFLPVED